MISIVVPCYNSQDTLDSCCKSLLNQTESNYEIILVNDGSTDSTGIICEKYAEKYENVHVIHQKNAGLMAAWKNGVLQANSEYILFCDSDDWIAPDVVEKMENILNRYDVDMILYGMVIEYYGGNFIRHENFIRNGYFGKKEIEQEIFPDYFYNKKNRGMLIGSSRCNKLFRKEILMENMNLLSDAVSIGEDDVTSFSAILTADSLYNIADYFPYHYCRRIGSMMGNYSYEMVKDFIRLESELQKISDLKNYCYKEKIEVYFLKNILMLIKKIIVDMKFDNKEIIDSIQKIVENSEVNRAIGNKKLLCELGLRERVLAGLVKNKNYILCICITKAVAEVDRFFNSGRA